MNFPGGPPMMVIPPSAVPGAVAVVASKETPQGRKPPTVMDLLNESYQMERRLRMEILDTLNWIDGQFQRGEISEVDYKDQLVQLLGCYKSKKIEVVQKVLAAADLSIGALRKVNDLIRTN